MILLDFLFLCKQTVCLRPSRTTGDFAAARENFTVESDNLHRLIVFLENSYCVVDVVDNNRRAEQRLHETVKFLVVFDKVACKPVATGFGQNSAMFGSNRARSARRERTERNTSVTFLFQIVDKVSCVVFVFYEHVLHCAAECVFDCRFEVTRNGDNFRHNPHDFAFEHWVMLGVLHKAFHRFLITCIIVLYGSCEIEIAKYDCKFLVESKNVFAITLYRFLALHFA